METYLGMSIKFVTFVFLNSMNSCSVLHIKTVIEKKNTLTISDFYSIILKNSSFGG